MSSSTGKSSPRTRYGGMTLVELMVALAIGSFLLVGALTVFMQGRESFRVNESISRLQENARFVLDVMEPDVRMAHYWGLTSRTASVQGRATPLDPEPFVVANDCDTNWSVNLAAEVEGTNGYDWDCAAFGTAQATSDTLTIRRVAEDEDLAPGANTLYVQSARFEDSQVFVGPDLPAAPMPATSQTHRLVTNGYYVSQNSSLDTAGNNVPSLRMKTLTGGAAGIRVVDQEVLPGVEDMQVQFGVDTDDEDTPERGSIDRYVNPEDPILNPADAAFIEDAEILSVRVWLRIRAEQPEQGFTDTAANYVYADQDVAPINDGFRRVLVSKTIYLRNARPQI